MKALTLFLFAFSAVLVSSLCYFAQAGPEPITTTEKEVLPPVTPSNDFFRGHELELNIWGTWAFSSDQGSNHIANDDPFTPGLDPEEAVYVGMSVTYREPESLNPNTNVNLGPVSKNVFLGTDNVWGGGVDVKYFFNKYLGLGVEGLLLDAETQPAGGGLATFTARYPIGRFAPYLWLGAGALAGGGEVDRFFTETHTYSGGFVTSETETFHNVNINNDQVFFDGQIGAGLEIRVTPHIGFMADFAWNFVTSHDNSSRSDIITTPGGTNGGTTFPNNTAVNYVPGGSGDKDFGMVRFGLTFSY